MALEAGLERQLNRVGVGGNLDREGNLSSVKTAGGQAE